MKISEAWSTRWSSARRRRVTAVAPAPLLLALEPRVVYDGAAAAAAGAAHHHADPVANGPALAGEVSGHHLDANTGRQDSAAGRAANGHDKHDHHKTKQAIGSGAASSNSSEVVFIDPNVTDFQSLIASLPAGTPYVILNPDKDGLEQIAQYLQRHPGVATVDLISHGSEAQLQAGSTLLDTSDLSQYSAELAQIGAAMQPGGSFLIYGCDVAEGADGQMLVQQIAALTHLNVAASTNETGAAALGGDWTLEYRVGDVRISTLFTAASEQQYDHLLGQTVETYDAYANGGAGEVLASYVTSFTLDNITYTTDGAVESGVYTSATSNGYIDDAPLSTGATDGVLMINAPGDTPMTEVTISLADGDPMKVTSFDFDEGLSDGTIKVIPNGNTSEEVTLSGSQLSGLVNLSGNANFKAVTSIEIIDIGDSGYFTPTLNNFTYTDLSSPPQLTASGGNTAFTEGNNVAHTPSTPVTVDSGMTLTDGDSTTATTATVSITSGFQSGDTLAFTNTSSTTFGNISGSYSGSILSLSSSGGTATIAQWQAALDAVTYTDTAATPSTTTRTISFTVTSDGLTGGNTVTKHVTVADTDQIPIVTTTGGTTHYEAGSAATTIDSGVTVTDSDTATQASATVSIGTGFHSGDTLAFTNGSATLFGNIGVASYNAGTGVLTLTSAGATATDAQWTNALDAVTFASTSASYGNRTISFVTSDGTSNSAAATDTVDLTAPPQVTADSGSAAFVAGDNTASTPVVIDSGLTVTDGSTSTLLSATVSITGNFHSGEDVLAFTNTSGTYGNVSSSYNAATGVLTLTSSGDTATLAQWQAALDAVTYTDAAVTPNNQTRTISFSVTDANSVVSATATRTVTVTDTDQTPIVTTTGGTTNYFGGASATTIDSSITVSDLDNTTQSSGTVSIGAGFHSGDTLAFTNASATLFGNISVSSYNAGTGVLTLTSSGATATDAQWANVLSAVTFSSSSSSYGNRTISFVVNDGTKNSAATTDTIDVLNPAPVVTTDSGSASFVAGDNTASIPVAIDSGLTVTDPSTSTLTSAMTSITGNFHSGEDVLSFTNTSGTIFGNIAGSYSAGVLTLSSSGNTATLAQWQAALEAVTYTDTAVTPNNATRTISFSITDANSNISNTATRTVTVADTDQTPIVTTTGGTTDYIGGASATTIDSGITVSDLDNSTQSSATVSIGTGFHSGDTLAFTNTSATLYGNISASYNSTTGVMTLTSSGATATDAQWANALDAATFAAGAGATPGNRTISFVVNDGTENSAASTKTVDVIGPPIVTTDSGSASFVAGDNTTSTPVAVDSGLTLTDASSATLQSATVSITGNFHSGEDVLAFANTSSTTYGDVSGSYNATTGVLTLTSSGGATLAQWQAAVDAVTYTDTAVTPNNATRTISFAATDGNGNASNAATRTVTVADTDQTPIVTTTGGATVYVAGTSAVTIDGGVTVSDRDNTTQSSATASISSGFQSGDTLAFSNTSATLYGNISASYNSGTGVLTLTSSGATATDAQWANALESVTFSNGSGAVNGNRTIFFVVNDGTENSAAATKTVSVNDVPVVTMDSGSASFVAGDNTVSTPILVDGGLTVADASSASLQSATVAITGNFHSGEDVLAFTNNGSTMGDVVGSYNATTGVLTLTSSGGATLAQWNAALESVTYTDTAITPNAATRTLGFTVVDGNGNSSATATRSVTVTDTDQTPIVTTDAGSASFVAADNATSTPVVIDAGVTVSDRDNATLASATVAITGNFQSGEDVLAFANDGTTMGNVAGSYNASTGVLTLTSSGATATTSQWQAALASVTYTDSAITPNTATRTVTFSVNDGTETSAAATRSVTVSDTDQAPVVTTSASSPSYTAGSPAIVIDSQVTVADRDNTTLASGTVSIGVGFQSGDSLSFTNSSATAFGNISGSYNAATGVLSLTSAGASATDAQWANAFGAATFASGSSAPGGTRTIAFAVSDGTKSSAIATDSVVVAPSNPMPIPPSITIRSQPSPFVETPSSPPTEFVASPPIVLAALDEPAPLGTIPVPHTVTFEGVTLPIGAEPMQTIDTVFDLMQPILFTPTILPSVTERISLAEDRSFSLSLLTPQGGDAAGGLGTGPMDITLRQANGRPLPDWIQYDAATGILSGTVPPDGVQVLRVMVTERDAAGHLTQRVVVIELDTPHAAVPRGPSHAALPAGKPSLAAQFAQQRRALHVVQRTREAPRQPHSPA